MLSALILPLATVYAGVALGYGVGRSGVLDRLWARRLRPWSRGPRQAASRDAPAESEPRGSALEALSGLLFYALIPVLLFRAAVRVDPATLPWATLAAYFVPAVFAQLLLVQWVRRGQLHRRREPRPAGDDGGASAASEWAPLWAFTATFGNSVQMGVPVATALFGEAGLGLHLQIIALHALTLMTLATVQAEWFRAADAAPLGVDRGRRLSAVSAVSAVLRVALHTARHALIHPVVLPILAGLAFHAAGRVLPGWAETTLSAIASVAVPLCVLAIGWTLAEAEGWKALDGAFGRVGFKLLALPAWVGLVAAWGFGVQGQPLWVLVMAAALPAGANAVLFAQRYRVGQAEAAAAVVASTLCFALTAPLWLAILGWLAPLASNR
jgi:predicted permease